MSATLPTLPWFEPVADSPAIADGVAGIEIKAPAVVALERPTVLPVSGVFQLAAKDAEALPREDAFAALTLLVVEAGTARSVALRPARSAVGPETRSVPPDMRRGYFQADVFGQSGFVPRAGRYFVYAHLADLCSPAAEVRVVARS
jgi:hypothetical protein